MAWIKAGTSNKAIVCAGAYDSSSQTENKGIEVTLSSTNYTLVSYTVAATNGRIYYPYIYTRSNDGSGVNINLDDIVIYTSTHSSTDVTQPANRCIKITTTNVSANRLTMNWENPTDNESGLAGIMIVRIAGLPNSNPSYINQVNYSTNSSNGPTTTGTGWNVVYNGNVISSFIDSTILASTNYTYAIVARDKAYNYNSSSAIPGRNVVVRVNGTLISTNQRCDGLYLPSGVTLTIPAACTYTVRPGATIDVQGTISAAGNLSTSGISSPSFFNFNSGSRYIYNINATNSYGVSKANWNDGSICEIKGITTNVRDLTGLSGQSFANFIWNCSGQTVNDTLPAGMTVRGNFDVTSTGPSGSISLITGTYHIGGNLTQSPGTNLIINDGSTIHLNGTALQTLDIDNSAYNITFNNPAGILLNDSLIVRNYLTLDKGNISSGVNTLTMLANTKIFAIDGVLNFIPQFNWPVDLEYLAARTTGNELPSANTILRHLTLNTNGDIILNETAYVNGILNLTNGKMFTVASKLLILKNDATTLGGSPVSFIHGPMKKTGDDAFVFPIGKSNVFAPAAISAPNTITDEFTAEYFQSNPNPLYNINLHDGVLHTVSSQEYWTLNRNVGSSTISLNLSWDTTRSGIITNVNDLRVALWNGSQWTNMGNTLTTGTVPAGTLTSAAGIGTFGAFTLSSISSSNPLPVKLISFSASKTNAGVELSWKTATEINNDYFSILRSDDGKNFYERTSVKAKGFSSNIVEYKFIDDKAIVGTVYYKLKQVDFDGTITCFNTIVVTDPSKSLSNVTILGNGSSNINLSVSSTKNSVNFSYTINNLSGQPVKEESFDINSENTMINGISDGLQTGHYILVSKTGERIEYKRIFVLN